MPLTLEQYARELEAKGDPYPAGPDPQPFESVKPSGKRLPGVRAVVWNCYGTLLLLDGCELHPVNPDRIMRKIALDKTIREFNMWQSMTRKPGDPADYMAQMLGTIVDQLNMSVAAAKDSVLPIERMWQKMVERLQKKEYSYDAGTYGDVEEYSRKIAYFYLRAGQGAALPAGAADALRELAGRGIRQGIHAASQCATPPQLLLKLEARGPVQSLGELFDPALCSWAHQNGVKAHSPSGFERLVRDVRQAGLAPAQVLYVGNDVDTHVAPAKAAGFRTALLLFDRRSGVVRKEALHDPQTAPDLLLTAHRQLLKVLA